MSRKRYNSGSRGGSPYQGFLNSTSTQQANYEDSLTAECLIRAFMEKGNMDDPILKTLFIGGSKPREDENEEELLFRRMKNSWLEKKGRNYGLKEFLRMKMKECSIKTDVDGRWAKYSIMKAPLIITPKIWINRRGEERREDFQNIFNWKFLEMIIRIDKNGYPNSLMDMIEERLIIHRWDQFPDKEPVIRQGQKWSKTFHLIKDDLNMYHHVILLRYQLENLDAFYEEQNKGAIQLVQQDWSYFICRARGKKRLMTTVKAKASSRNTSKERVRSDTIPRKVDCEKQGQQEIVVEERMSDQESQQSQGTMRKMRVDQQGTTVVRFNKSQIQKELQDIEMIQRTLDLAQLSEGDADIDIYPKDIFPKGILKFAEEFGVNNCFRLFLKLNYEQVTSGKLKNREKFNRDHANMMNDLREKILKDTSFMKAETVDQFDNFTKEYYGILDAIYMGSEIIIYVSKERICKLIEVRRFGYNHIDRYFKILRHPVDDMRQIAAILLEATKQYGLTRMSLSDKLTICPLCASVWERSEILKHPCTASVDLAIKGRPQ